MEKKKILHICYRCARDWYSSTSKRQKLWIALLMPSEVSKTALQSGKKKSRGCTATRGLCWHSYAGLLQVLFPLVWTSFKERKWATWATTLSPAPTTTWPQNLKANSWKDSWRAKWNSAVMVHLYALVDKFLLAQILWGWKRVKYAKLTLARSLMEQMLDHFSTKLHLCKL